MKNSRFSLFLKDLWSGFKEATLLGKIFIFCMTVIGTTTHIVVIFLTIYLVIYHWYWGIVVGFIFVTLLSALWDDTLKGY